MIEITLCDDLSTVSAVSWNRLFDTDMPFCQHAFLVALEQGGSVGEGSGWLPQHLLLYRDGSLVAAMPMYLKLHSYGEYLFDWAIAEAYQHHNLAYYPKLLCAIPFTPAEGPRFGVAATEQPAQIFGLLFKAISQRQQQLACSNFQCLYPDFPLQQIMRGSGMLERFDVQFQWHNHNYDAFSDFLAALPSRKRKQISKERAQVSAQGIIVKYHAGSELTPDFWHKFSQFYQATYQKRSGHNGYLTPETMLLWGRDMAESIVVFAAYLNDRLVAASLCFKSTDCLYGRYWGCLAEFDKLHFECCYYAGIDYCIANKIVKFDAGAQGEHKLKRGFVPVIRRGFYQFSPSPLTEAIADYCQREQQALLQHYQLMT
ncbi:MAG: GNAT family N-acetyltransferase [Rheinheimera sp.]|uniref:GNAT family N-acetyltransferase n=1 Tax=Arsukibacterium sp. UBA3155 TaxID=1946058 RepID=UPI000C97826C|nr:GNAT family N-acetyltransferase [Arsukibacterium sp. UBA3155]MAD74363.1 GNAT family N-acetyltransferase [Rheinheimera sp.]|tara:strand:+ start:38256 stop:39371 length:1116 start_codon:yes stop_codon:yes gene_type:complete